MPTAGSYRLEHQLSSCTVGEVWSGADEQGRPVTVARLNELASADSRWRDAFAAATETLAASETDRLAVTGSDLAGERPWVASDGDAGAIFTVLGQDLTPVGAVPATLSAAGMATDHQPDSVRTESRPSVEGEPPTEPLRPVLTDPAQPVSAAPVSGLPTSGLPSFDQPVSAVPVSGAPAPYRGMGSPPRPGRLLLLIVGLVSLLVGAAGGAAIVAAASVGDDEPAPVASSGPVTFTDAQLLLPSTQPAAPGQSPEPDEWPDNNWPTFGDQAGATEVSGLEGLGFSFQTPEGWKCVLAEKADAAVHYRCGAFDGDTITAGGDIFYRTCPAVCDNTTRVALRAREEAWGLRWTGGTTVQSWVENPSVNGKPEFGLVYVGFTRTAVEQVLNREVVLRMTAPADRADDVKKVAASVLDHTYAQ
ncbi:hypothetical protein [Actinoplanes sp. NPDC020271]|uniref:hypothetical protein n=1 Tax=Actinoplanes sp. NPDC020271 TaxID=3363896 RepID=UPI00378E13F2